MRKIQTSNDFEYATLEQVKKRLLSKGIKEPGRPATELPPIPAELGDLPGEDVIELFGIYTGHYEHITYLCTLAELATIEWKNNLKYRLAEHKRDSPDEDPELDPVLVDIKRQAQIQEQEAKILEAHKSGLHRRMAAVSRAVEVLKMGSAASARGGNMGRKWD